MANLTALFGGRFDPVHRGHVEPLRALLDAGVVDAAVVVPVAQPVHKMATCASGAERLEMLRLAYTGDERVRVSDIEMRQSRPSYTVWTLRELKEANPDTQLCFVLGADWSRGVDDWYRGSEFPALAHLIVMNRPGSPQASVACKGFEQTDDLNELRVTPSGLCYAFSGPELDISSAEVRESLANGEDQQWLSDALPAKVFDYIKSKGLYR